ncbi:MAG: hypothetical protein M3R24_31970, partial [Chloroflexota bacterium]|nr:hypothetical protein [Chloroflexota bacterium]
MATVREKFPLLNDELKDSMSHLRSHIESGGTQGSRSTSKPDLLDAAELWASLNEAHLAYDIEANVWRMFVNTHWGEVHKTQLDEVATTVLRQIGLPVSTASRLDGLIRVAAMKCTRLFPLQAHLINFQNGTLDLNSMELRSHGEGDGLVYCLPYDFYPGSHPRIDAFLADTLPDKSAVASFKTHVGLALRGDTSMHVVSTVTGPPRVGKTTLLRLSNLICGQSSSEFAGPSLFCRDVEGKRSRAMWNARRITCIDEFPTEALKDEEVFKIMAAHGGVEMRRMNKDEETNNQWRPKLLLATNQIPHIRDISGAIGERLVILRTRDKRSNGKPDLKLIDALSAELGAFAATCIAYAGAALQAGGYPKSRSMLTAVQKMLLHGNPLRTFLEERCIMG